MQGPIGEVWRLQNPRHVEQLAPVLRAISHVQIPVDRTAILVRLMNVIGAWIQQRDHRQPDAMRPRVVGVDIHVAAGAPPCLQHHAVVALRAAVVILRNIAEVGLRVRKIEYPPLIDIASRGTGTGRYEAVLPGDTISWNVLGGIELDCVPDVNDMGSYVGSRYEQTGRHLPLDAEIPGILCVCLHIRRHRQVGTIRRKYRVTPIEIVRERIYPKISWISPGII